MMLTGVLGYFLYIVVLGHTTVFLTQVDDLDSQHLATYTAFLLNLRCGSALSSRLNHVVA